MQENKILFMNIYNAKTIFILFMIFTMQEKIIILFINNYNTRKNINDVCDYLQCKKKY